MNQQDASRIKELGLDALKNPNPNVRKEALLELRQYDTPIIKDVLEQVIRKDHDKAVRDLAQNLLTKRQIQESQRTHEANKSSPPQDGPKFSGDTWTCSFCGSTLTGHDRCTNCGAERPAAHANRSPIVTKMEVDPETFLLNPQHRDFVGGKSKVLSRNSAFGVGCISLFLSLFVLFGGIFLILTLRDTYEWFAVSRGGVANTAQYIDRRVSSGDDSDTYYVSFKYTHNGKKYEREQRVSWDIYNRAEIGGNLDIVYVPASPQVAKIAGLNNAPIAPLLFVIFWNGIVYLVIFFAVRQYRRTKFLERNGKMLRGEILESTHSTDSDGDLSLKVEYAFYIPESKQRLTKTQHAQRNDLKGKRPPAPGTPVVVLYYNEHQHMLL